MLHDIDDPQWERIFKRFKERAVESQDNPELIDPVIMKTIKLLNSIDGIATTWSCQAHPFEQNPEGPEQVGPGRGYIALVVKCGCSQNELLRIFNNINARLWVDTKYLDMADVEISLTSGLDDVGMKETEMYPSIVIRTPYFKNTRIRNRWWNRFHNCLKDAYKTK